MTLMTQREAPANTVPTAPARRAFWMRTLHQWHWISAAVSLAGMLLFSVTGITLNHAGAIGATPMTQARAAQLPEALLGLIEPEAQARLPPDVARWLEGELDIRIGGRRAEVASGEAYMALPRPGGDAWLSIDLDSGAVEYERTDRGAVALLNDLHKGRGTGAAWAWFIDVFAIACVVFCLTGLFLLCMHARQRRSTWPVVGLGLVLPVVLAIFSIH